MARSLFYDGHMGGNRGNGIPDGVVDAQRNFSAGNGPRMDEFDFLGVCRLPMGAPDVLSDRLFDSLQPSQRRRLSALSEMDQVLQAEEREDESRRRGTGDPGVEGVKPSSPVFLLRPRRRSHL